MTAKTTPCRIFTAGHVDDGKSTLIGRLLHDSRSLFDDHLVSLKRDSAKKGFSTLDFSLLTDGLKAEREQGITIDVAYRYFSTPNRKFILADTPGHEEYTRNMATAASTADVLLLLVDVRHPIAEQTRRHSLIASLFGIKQVVVAVNKMDLVAYSSDAFEKIKQDYQAFASGLTIPHLLFIPVSALKGDNIVEKSLSMPWYEGAPLLESLETLSLPERPSSALWRFPIQTILRSKTGGRFYAGVVEMGLLRKGAETISLPSGEKNRIRAIFHREKEVEEALQGESISLELEKEIDASRGSLLSSVEQMPRSLLRLEAILIWMDNTAPAAVNFSYLLHHASQTVPAKIEAIHHTIDVLTLQPNESNSLALNEIARVSLSLQKPIFADPYETNRSTGSFILIDPMTNRTVAAGLIQKEEIKSPKGLHLVRASSLISPVERARAFGQKGRVIWFTGLSGSGKTTLSLALEKKLFELGRFAYVLDGDNIRHGLSRDLGFSAEERKENVRRIGEVAALFVDAGMIVITAFISPFRVERELARLAAPPGSFSEIYLNASLATCETRDPKGLYKKARSGQISDFTGISSPYEPPLNPDLILDTSTLDCNACVELLLQFLQKEERKGKDYPSIHNQMPT